MDTLKGAILSRYPDAKITEFSKITGRGVDFNKSLMLIERLRTDINRFVVIKNNSTNTFDKFVTHFFGAKASKKNNTVLYMFILRRGKNSAVVRGSMEELDFILRKD